MSEKKGGTKAEIARILKENNQGIKLDIGCGGSKMGGFVGIDVRPLPGVDIVWDLGKFNWPLPHESVSFAMSSHLIEHLTPGAPDPRLVGLVELLKSKKVLTEKEIKEFIGEVDTGPIFMRFMDEVWRILKPGAQFMSALPYAMSKGYYQDPTHINPVTEVTWTYFDPLAPGGLYYIYKPKPWKIVSCQFSVHGNMEVLLEKRKMDKSYGG